MDASPAGFTKTQLCALAWVFLTGRAPRCPARAEAAIKRHWRFPPFSLAPAEIVSAQAMRLVRDHPMTRAVRVMQGRGFVIDDARLMCNTAFPSVKRIPMLRHGRAVGEVPADNLALVDHRGRLYQRGRFVNLRELERGSR